MPAILQVAPRSPRGSRPIPTRSRSSHVTCANGLPTAAAVTRRPCLFRPVPHGRASGGGKVEGNPADAWLRAPYRPGQRAELMSDSRHAWDAHRTVGYTDTRLRETAAAPRRVPGMRDGVGEHADVTCRPQFVDRPQRTTRSGISRAVRRGGEGVGGRGAVPGLLGWLSTAWLTVNATVAGSGALLRPLVRQCEPGPGGKRRIAAAYLVKKPVSNLAFTTANRRPKRPRCRHLEQVTWRRQGGLAAWVVVEGDGASVSRCACSMSRPRRSTARW
jgi:hypothetical protein